MDQSIEAQPLKLCGAAFYRNGRFRDQRPIAAMS